MGSESAAWEHHLDDRAGALLTGSTSSLLLLHRQCDSSSHHYFSLLPIPPAAKNLIYKTVNLSLCKNVTFGWQSGKYNDPL